jgi:hypothetical protein
MTEPSPDEFATTAKQRRGWVEQGNLTYLGLIGIGLILVQPFLTAPLDLTALICVVAFAVAIPLNAILLMLTYIDELADHLISSRMVSVATSVARVSAVVGVVAAFWHMTWIAGVAVILSGVFGLLVYTAAYTKLPFARRRSKATQPPIR